MESRDVRADGDIEAALASTMFGRPSDPAHETPGAGASSVSNLPLCEPEAADPIEPGTGTSHRELGESTAAMLELAIPAAYPGARLVPGEGAWIVDSTGRSERVHFGRAERSGDGVALFAVHFPGRSAVAARRLADGVPDRYCRAPAELLVARWNVDGSFAGAHLLPVDNEAVASDVSTARLDDAGPGGGETRVLVRYTALHAGDGWTGSLDSEAVITDDARRTTARVPLTFATQARGVGEPSLGHLVVTGRPGGGVELSTLEQHEWGFSTRTVVVPLDAGGVLPGASILGKLF